MKSTEWNEKFNEQEKTGVVSGTGKVPCDRTTCTHRKKWTCAHPDSNTWTKWNPSSGKDACPCT